MTIKSKIYVMSYLPANDRYDHKIDYRRCGVSGIKLPEISLDYGITLVELMFWKMAVRCCATHLIRGLLILILPITMVLPRDRLKKILAQYSGKIFFLSGNELIISTKAGYLMWPGPYGRMGLPQIFVIQS